MVVWRQQRVLSPGSDPDFKSVPVPWLLSGVVTPTWFVPWLISPAAPPTLTRSDLASAADSALTLEARSVLPACPIPAAPSLCRKPGGLSTQGVVMGDWHGLWVS